VEKQTYSTTNACEAYVVPAAAVNAAGGSSVTLVDTPGFGCQFRDMTTLAPLEILRMAKKALPDGYVGLLLFTRLFPFGDSHRSILIVLLLQRQVLVCHCRPEGHGKEQIHTQRQLEARDKGLMPAILQ